MDINYANLVRLRSAILREYDEGKKPEDLYPNTPGYLIDLAFRIQEKGSVESLLIEELIGIDVKRDLSRKEWTWFSNLCYTNFEIWEKSSEGNPKFLLYRSFRGHALAIALAVSFMGILKSTRKPMASMKVLSYLTGLGTENLKRPVERAIKSYPDLRDARTEKDKKLKIPRTFELVRDEQEKTSFHDEALTVMGEDLQTLSLKMRRFGNKEDQTLPEIIEGLNRIIGLD